MTDTIFLTANVRKTSGTGSARELRRNNKVPAIIYGNGKENLSIELDTNQVMKFCIYSTFVSTIVELDVDGIKYKVLPKDVSFHPTTDIVTHLDFMYLGQETHNLKAPIVFDGKNNTIGVKRGGYFNIVKRSINITSDSNTIPQRIVVNVLSMRVGQSLKAKDLPMPEGCKLNCDPNLIIASIIGSKGGAGADSEEKGSA